MEAQGRPEATLEIARVRTTCNHRRNAPTLSQTRTSAQPSGHIGRKGQAKSGELWKSTGGPDVARARNKERLLKPSMPKTAPKTTIHGLPWSSMVSHPTFSVPPSVFLFPTALPPEPHFVRSLPARSPVPAQPGRRPSALQCCGGRGAQLRDRRREALGGQREIRGGFDDPGLEERPKGLKH